MELIDTNKSYGYVALVKIRPEELSRLILLPKWEEEMSDVFKIFSKRFITAK